VDLHVTLTSAPPVAFPAREIVVDTFALPTGAALADRLGAAGYEGPFTIDGASLTESTAGEGRLTDGAVIVCGAPAARVAPARVPPLAFVVHAGPDAGQVIPLSRGSYTIGRASGDITIADPAVSRRHALLTVARDAVVIEDLSSVNGTFVDGERISRAHITVSAALLLGRSRCRVELVDDDGWRYVSPVGVLEPVPVGSEPPRRPSRLLVLTAVLPLVLGVVLAVTTGLWFFLAFSALSAVTGLVPLLTHRRDARVFADAVRDAAGRDRERRIAAVPDPGQTALDALRARLHGPAGRTAVCAPLSPAILLRLGTADQPANLAAGRVAATFTPPILADLPLVVPIHPSGGAGAPPGTDEAGEPSFTVAGEAAAVMGLLRALLLQVAHPLLGAPAVVCSGPVRHLPLPARFLPNVRLTQDPRVLAGIMEQTDVLLVLQIGEDPPGIARRSGIAVVRFLPDDSAADGPTSGTALPSAGMVLTADGARARIDGREYLLLPDGVSERTFERTARALAGASRRPGAATARRPDAGHAAGVLPAAVSLWSGSLRPDTLASSVPARWSTADAARPEALIGRSCTGPVSIDLVRDGPHLLIAGTTGSGKSEFLRTLVLGFALDQPPGQLSLLLIDYKGGSGLGALAALPHCVGALTDLSSESTARALTSLRAELRRREGLCADHGADDLEELRRIAPRACPPRLVVVIDEFRMLGDDVPTAVPDLMRIAVLGRSLGVHLVLATQRAQGAVTPDMRANITTSILFRVQTAMESQDLLGTGAAADIPVDVPGRAFLRRGSEPPVAVQVASSSDLPRTNATPGWQDVETYLEGPWTGGPHRESRAPDSTDGTASTASTNGTDSTDGTASARGAAAPAPTVLGRAVAGLLAAAGGVAAPRPSRPVLPTLPDRLTLAACATFPPADQPDSSADGSAEAPGVPLGVIDLPDRQVQRRLQWDPYNHSHLALIGLPGSGAAEALAAVVAALPAADPDVHLYVLDGDGTLGACSTDPHVGAYVLPEETKRAGRVLERLAGLPARSREDTCPVVLVVTGWGRWSSRFRNSRLARAEDDLHGLVRDGARNGVTVLISGDRELTTSRLFALLPNRIYLPLGAHQETTMTWPRMPPVDPVPGRGFAQGRITGSWGDGTCQLLTAPAAGAGPARPPGRAPFPVHPLPRVVLLSDIVPAGRTAGRTGGRTAERMGERTGGARPGEENLLLGVHGDDLRVFSVILRPGEVYPVLGHAGSGRSNALRVLAHAAARLTPPCSVLAPPIGAPPAAALAYWQDLAGRSAGPDPAARYLLVVDDADRLPAEVQQTLSGFVARGAAAVLAAAPGPALMTRMPLALNARAAGRGLVLAPRTAADGDLLGVRLDPDGPLIPGRGFACDPAGIVEVQVARATDDPEEAGAPSGSAAPYSALSDPVVRTVYSTTGLEKSVTMTTAAGTRRPRPTRGAPVEK
jgi:S-DNA-T family DNA segregation ATPase FtsK/SpoIIIE